MGGYEPNQMDHTFSTGRTMRIRKRLPATWLAVHAAEKDGSEMALAVLMGGGMTPAAIGTVIESMFLEPRVVWDPDDAPPVDDPGDGSWPPVIPATDLMDDEIQEAFEIAMEGVEQTARFRGDVDGVGDGEDRAGVGAKPKQRSRASGGKR